MPTDANTAVVALKGAYLRHLDAGDWDRLVEVFAPEVEIDIEGAVAGRSSRRTSTAEAFVSGVARSLNGATTRHRAELVELSFPTPSSAIGVWSMTDEIDWPPGGPVRSLRGSGRYRERYVHTDDGWRIAALGLEREHVEVVEASLTFDDADPTEPDAATALAAYLAELDRRGVCARDAGTDDPAWYRPPTGAFVVARSDGVVVGCGAVRRVDDGTGEIKRMWLSPSWRGRGVGHRQLAALEDRVRSLGHHRVVLDTHSTLTEAVQLYERSGYRRIDRYNDNPDAQLWFAKDL